METNLVGTMLGGAKDVIMGNVSDALPIAGTIFGALAGIAVGVKLFKKLTGARA